MNNIVKYACAVYGKIGYDLLKYIVNFDQTKRPKFVITSKEFDLKYSLIETLCYRYQIPIIKNINSKETRKLLKKQNIDVCFLLWFPEIIKKSTIESVNIGFINLHPSLLGNCAGMHPWYWNFIEDCSHGVTIHFINDKIDQGRILFQKKVDKDITYTGENIYSICQLTIENLFKDNFVKLIDKEFLLKDDHKEIEIKSFHYAKELNKHSCIDLNKKYKAMDLINILRARTFKNGQSSFFYKDGKKYEIRVNIKEIT